MSKKLGHRKKADLKAKAAKCLIDPKEPPADMGPGIPLSEAGMLRNLDKAERAVWSAAANRPDIHPHLHGGGNGRVSHKRNEY